MAGSIFQCASGDDCLNITCASAGVMSSLAALESSVVKEYSKRCWTKKAKEQKYVKIYTLLQQGSRTTLTSPEHSPLTVTTTTIKAKHAQFRTLMAKVCLSKLACPVSATLHYLEATVGYAECQLFQQAAECLQDAMAAVQHNHPKTGSIAAAIAALKSPQAVPPINLPHLQLPGASITSSFGSEESSSDNPWKSVYDASHTVYGVERIAADTTNDPRHPVHQPTFHAHSLSTMFSASASSATFSGPSASAPPPTLGDAAAMFQRAQSEPEGVGDHRMEVDSLEKFFADLSPASAGMVSTQKSDPASLLAQRLRFVLLQLVLYLSRPLLAASSPSSPFSKLPFHTSHLAPATLITLLRSSLDLVSWLDIKQSLHPPECGRQFDFSSEIWRTLLGSGSRPGISTLEQRVAFSQASVRTELASLLIKQWLDKQALVQPLLHSVTSKSAPGNSSAPSAELLECVNELNDARRILEVMLDAQTERSSFQSVSGESDAFAVGFGDISEEVTRLDLALISRLVDLLSHSRMRLSLSRSTIAEYDRAHCMPRGTFGGPMLFAASVYCPQPVKQLQTRLKHYLTAPDPRLARQSAASLAILRSCWGLLQVAGEVGPTLDSMFGVESRPHIEPSNVVRTAPLTPSAPSPPRSVSNTRLKIARRQVSIQLRNSVLDEYDAIVMLYWKRLEEASTSTPMRAGIATVKASSTSVLLEQLWKALKNDLQSHCDRIDSQRLKLSERNSGIHVGFDFTVRTTQPEQ